MVLFKLREDFIIFILNDFWYISAKNSKYFKTVTDSTEANSLQVTGETP